MATTQKRAEFDSVSSSGKLAKHGWENGEVWSKEETKLVFCNKAGWGQVLVWIWQQIIQRTQMVSLFSPSKVECEHICRRCRVRTVEVFDKSCREQKEDWWEKNIVITCWQCRIPKWRWSRFPCVNFPQQHRGAHADTEKENSLVTVVMTWMWPSEREVIGCRNG